MNPLARLSRRDRRALSLGTLALVPALLFGGVIRPYFRVLAEDRERLAAEQALLARERELLAAHAARATEISRRPPDARLARRLFDGRDDLLIAADVSGYVQDLARLSRLNLTSLESGASDSTRAGLRTYPVEIRGEGDLEAVMTFLRLAENGQALLRVERLTVEPSRAAAAPLLFAGVGAGVAAGPVEPDRSRGVSVTASLLGYGRLVQVAPDSTATR